VKQWSFEASAESDVEILDDDPTRVAPTVRPPPVRRLGRYVVTHTLATGGMATVHLGAARGAGRFAKVFAIKQVHPHLAAQRAFRDMFEDEARIASLLNHPNVCGVFDFGETDGSPFLVMEYLVGVPLSRLAWMITRVSHPMERAQVHMLSARIVADACEGLHAAHELRDEQGELLHVVHRDVSLSNLFVTADGTLKVLDFGVAKALNRIHETTTGTIKGKFAYMSPEQLRGGIVDRRADVWSLGVILWELLSGRRLFRGGSEAETVTRVLTGRTSIPPESGVAADPELAAIVQQALARELTHRFPTARAMGQALRAWLARQQPGASAIEMSACVTRWFAVEVTEQRRLAGSAIAEATVFCSVDQVREVASASAVFTSRSGERRRRLRVTSIAVASVALAFATGWLLAGSDATSDPVRIHYAAPPSRSATSRESNLPIGGEGQSEPTPSIETESSAPRPRRGARKQSTDSTTATEPTLIREYPF